MDAGPSCDVREFGSDVAAANQGDARGEPIKLKKFFAGDSMLLAGDIQRYRARTSSDQDVPSLELPAFDDNHISTGEAGKPAKGVDTVFGEIPFPIAGHSIGEAAFKHHQVAPINPRFARDAMPAHARLRVDHLSAADQHLLRIAAAQRAGPAERTVID